jgi:hypothetical protein
MKTYGHASRENVSALVGAGVAAATHGQPLRPPGVDWSLPLIVLRLHLRLFTGWPIFTFRAPDLCIAPLGVPALDILRGACDTSSDVGSPPVGAPTFVTQHDPHETQELRIGTKFSSGSTG